MYLQIFIVAPLPGTASHYLKSQYWKAVLKNDLYLSFFYEGEGRMYGDSKMKTYITYVK